MLQHKVQVFVAPFTVPSRNATFFSRDGRLRMPEREQSWQLKRQKYTQQIQWSLQAARMDKIEGDN